MKILFLVYHGFSDHSGISKKIKGQVKGLVENGAQVELAHYDIDAHGERSWVVAGKSVVTLGKGWLGKIRKRVDFKGFQEYIIAQNYDLVYIRSYHNANPFSIGFVKGIKKSGVKVVLEIPTYPYDQEYQDWRSKPRLWIDMIFRKSFMKYVDAVITFSDDTEIFGQRTIQISNGIDFQSIPLRKMRTGSGTAIHLLAVAEIHYWHGFDRILEGLGAYYENNPTTAVLFHLVGEYSGARERREIQTVIDKFGLHDRVIIHGALFGDQLDAVFDQCDFALGSLGRHRTGITRMRSLKNREYAARGIPFAYAESDPDFDHQPYIVKYPADETALNIVYILDYLKANNILPEEINESIQSLSWKTQMGIVLSKL